MTEMAAVLASIEHKLGEVFGRTRGSGRKLDEAAEAAVRRATLEVLRQVGTSPAALDPAFKEELDDLRRAQEMSGERTHETLAAVHETLERVVDRLAAFEDEITEIRGEGLATESSFDSGPARRGVQGAAEDAARELARFKPAELKEDRAEPKFAAPPPRVRRGQTSRTWILIRSPQPNLESRAEKRRRNPISSPPRAGPLYRLPPIPTRWTPRKKSGRAAAREGLSNTGATGGVGADHSGAKASAPIGARRSGGAGWPFPIGALCHRPRRRRSNRA